MEQQLENTDVIVNVLPGPEALLTDRPEGAVRLVRHADGIIKIYQRRGGEWMPIPVDNHTGEADFSTGHVDDSPTVDDNTFTYTGEVAEAPGTGDVDDSIAHITIQRGRSDWMSVSVAQDLRSENHKLKEENCKLKETLLDMGQQTKNIAAAVFKIASDVGENGYVADSVLSSTLRSISEDLGRDTQSEDLSTKWWQDMASSFDIGGHNLRHPRK